MPLIQLGGAPPSCFIHPRSSWLSFWLFLALLAFLLALKSPGLPGLPSGFPLDSLSIHHTALCQSVFPVPFKLLSLSVPGHMAHSECIVSIMLAFKG